MQGSGVENEIVTRVAGTAARRASSGSLPASVFADADWDVVLGQLARTRLLPTLGPRVVGAAEEHAPASFAAAVTSSILATQRQDALIGTTADLVDAALRERGIRSAGLKGPALGEEIFGEPGRRLSGDVDVLVEPSRLQDAAEAVRELGYGSPSDPCIEGDMPLLHLALDHLDRHLPTVELHWRVHWYESRFAAERLLPPEPGLEGWRPDPIDELAALFLFYARDGFSGLRQAVDLAAWWDRFGGQVPKGAMVELGSRYPQLRGAWSAAITVADRVVGVPSAHLGLGVDDLGPRGRIALRLADPRPYASEAQMFAEVGLFDGLLAPIRTLPAFFRRQVFPPRALLRDRSAKSPGVRLDSQFGYGVRILGRCALALGRLARIPFASRARFLY